LKRKLTTLAIWILVIVIGFQFCYTEVTIRRLNKNLNTLKQTITNISTATLDAIKNLDKKPDFHKLKLATVQIKLGKFDKKPAPGGAGVLIKGIKKHLYILTVQHITKKKSILSVKIRKTNDEYITLENINKKLIYQDDKVDLALIKIPKPKGEFIYLDLAENNPNIGNKVTIIGHPFCFPYTLNEGIITNYSKRISCTKEKAEYFQLNAPAINGNSGGAVVNNNTELIGIMMGIMYIDKETFFKDIMLFPTYSFAVKTEDIKRFLQEVENK